MVSGNLIVRRIWKLCNERNITIYVLSQNCENLGYSTLHELVNSKDPNPKANTIEKICNGFDISIGEFYNDSIFLKK